MVFRFGKGRKQRSVPLPLAARRPLETYLEGRPPVDERPGVCWRARVR